MKHAAFLVAALIMTAGARAEDQGGQSLPAPAANDVARPYEPDLLALLETIGSLSALAPLCEDMKLAPAEAWRREADALINAEAASGERRSRLIGAYNRGYEGYALLHRTCAPQTRLAAERLLGEAGRLSRIVAARFGG